MEYKKMTITLTKEVVEIIEKSSKQKNMSKSGYIAYTIQEMEKQDKAMESISTLVQMMKEKQNPKPEN